MGETRSRYGGHGEEKNPLALWECELRTFHTVVIRYTDHVTAPQTASVTK